MANQHRRNRPRNEAWETPDPHNQATPGNIMFGQRKTLSSISSRLWRALRGDNAQNAYRLIQHLRAKPYEDDPNEDDEKWQVWRFLGAGGQGSAAVWIRKDADGELVDEIVIKEMRIPGSVLRYWIDNPRISREAVLQAEINKHGCENIVHLRDFKCHMNQTDLLDVQRSESGIAWRYYLEYAPYGDLENLRMRYRAFHRYLPELFLWHVFDSLARAIVVLEDLRDLRNRTKPLGKYMTHCDIKPQNIFLGYEEHHDEDGPTGGLKDGRYPTIKLGDFGLAELQDEMRRGSNFKDMAGIGTLNYLPPEQGRLNADGNVFAAYGSNFQPPVNVQEPHFTAQANVWAVGKVMYDLFCLARHHDYHKIQARDSYKYHDMNHGNTLPEWTSTPFRDDWYRQKSPYTRGLSALIRACMEANPDNRPTARQLYQSTSDELKSCLEKAPSLDPVSVRNDKLYYRGNEINDMTVEETNCYHLTDPWEYFQLLAPGVNGPDLPRLRIAPQQVRENVFSDNNVRDDADVMDEEFDNEFERQAKQYSYRNNQVAQGNIEKRGDRIHFNQARRLSIPPSPPPGPPRDEKRLSRNFYNTGDSEGDIDNMTKRYKRRRLDLDKAAIPKAQDHWDARQAGADAQFMGPRPNALANPDPLHHIDEMLGAVGPGNEALPVNPAPVPQSQARDNPADTWSIAQRTSRNALGIQPNPDPATLAFGGIPPPGDDFYRQYIRRLQGAQVRDAYGMHQQADQDHDRAAATTGNAPDPAGNPDVPIPTIEADGPANNSRHPTVGLGSADDRTLSLNTPSRRLKTVPRRGPLTERTSNHVGTTTAGVSGTERMPVADHHDVQAQAQHEPAQRSRLGPRSTHQSAARQHDHQSQGRHSASATSKRPTSETAQVATHGEEIAPPSASPRPASEEAAPAAHEESGASPSASNTDSPAAPIIVPPPARGRGVRGRPPGRGHGRGRGQAVADNGGGRGGAQGQRGRGRGRPRGSRAAANVVQHVAPQTSEERRAVQVELRNKRAADRAANRRGG